MPRHGCNLRNRFSDFEQARNTFMSKVVEAQVFNFQNFACQRECGADGVAVIWERTLPPLPEDCRALSRAGVQQGDRLDIALLKIDRALTRQNMRSTRCAEWYDQLRAGLQASPAESAL